MPRSHDCFLLSSFAFHTGNHFICGRILSYLIVSYHTTRLQYADYMVSGVEKIAGLSGDESHVVE